ncbi:Non-specific serine/threonine protein kinase [Bertholletia excelsa]
MTKAERETVIVVLDGTKTLTEKNGVVPLRWALKELVETKDLVVVLTILDPGTHPDDSPLNAGCCCGGDDWFEQQHTREGDSYIEFLHEEMRKEPLKHLKHVFGPYRDKCKTIGVKFLVKIAAGSEPEDLVVQEANNIDATWIVVDRCFAQNQSFQLSGTYCKVVLVGGDGDTQFVDTKSNPEEYPKPEERLVSPGESHVHVPRECEKPQNFESWNEIQHQVNMELPGESIVINYENISFAGLCNVNLVVRMPLELSWEMVEEITGGFTRMTCIGKNESFKMYHGYLSDHHSQVLVKRFAGEVDHIVKVEKRAALSMYHKNILGLIGYHKSKNGTILVYPFSRRRTLERFIYGSKGKHLRLTFQEKIKIAVGIGQGLRYMHEECPRGPVVHGDLRPCNIFLNYDLEPQITGFGQATWLQLKQGY